MIIDELIDKSSKYVYGENQEELKKEKFKAILETTRHQLENCQLYRQWSKQKNFDPRRDLKSLDDIHKIPHLTTANFKGKSGRPKELICVPESEIQAWTTSSGTSGDPSMIGRDHINVVRFKKMFDFFVKEIVGNNGYDWSFSFQPPAQKRLTIDDIIPEPMHHFMWAFNVISELPLEDRVFALKLASEEERKQGKPFVLDPEVTFGFLGSDPSKKGVGWIGGSIPLMYMILTEYYKKTGQTFTVGEKSFMVSGGGWKTFSGDAVSPEKFREDISKILGFPAGQIHDVYSFTESDCVHVECEHHNKHLLPWQDVIVRDVETLEPVEMGEKGLINVINPLAHGYAGVSILQDDIVRVVMEDECPCGRKGKIIEVIGRAEGAEAKGCGAQLAEETN